MDLFVYNMWQIGLSPPAQLAASRHHSAAPPQADSERDLIALRTAGNTAACWTLDGLEMLYRIRSITHQSVSKATFRLTVDFGPHYEEVWSETDAVSITILLKPSG